MKKIAILLILILFGYIVYGQNELDIAPVTFQLFPETPKGLNTNLPSHLISPIEFQDCENVLFDDSNYVTRRDGYKQTNNVFNSTASIKYMFEYSKIGGNKYMVILSSNILAYSMNGIAYTTLLSTIPTNAKVWMVNYNDICYIGFSDTDTWKFNGTTIIASTMVPQIKYMTVYKDKLVGVNVNETYGRSKLAYSDIGLPEVWPALNYIYVDRDDGDELRAIRQYRGNLYVFKSNSIYQMIGLEDGYPTNDGYSKVVSGIGCLYQETIQEKDGYLYFVSKRGVEQFDGVNVILISKRIDPNIKNLTQMKSSALYWANTTADDFAAGTLYYTSTVTYPGSVAWTGLFVSSYNTTVDSTGDVGMFSSMKISTSNNNIHIAYYDATNKNLKYSSHTSQGWFTSTIDSTGDVGKYCSLALDGNNYTHISYYDETNGYLKYSSNTAAGWFTTIVDNTGDRTGLCTSIAIDKNNNPHISYFSLSGGNYIIYYSSHNSTDWHKEIMDVDVGGNNTLVLDNNNNPYMVYEAGLGSTVNFSSRTSSGWKISTIEYVWGSSFPSIYLDKNNTPSISYISSDNTLKYSSYTSIGWIKTEVDNSGLLLKSSIVLDSTGNPHIGYYEYYGGALKYIRYNTSSGWTKSFLDNVGDWPSIGISTDNLLCVSYYDQTNTNLKFYKNTDANFNLYPYFISTKFNATTADYNWLGWGSIAATENIPTSVSMKYYTRTSLTSGGLDSTAWEELTNNSTSKSNVGSWFQYKFDFVPTASVATARIDDITQEYFVDSQNKPLVSWINNRRYWLAGAIKPAINNNVVYVLDQNNNWTKFTNMEVGAFCDFKDDFYFGVSTESGKIFKYSSIYTDDNGTAISPFIKTPDYDFGTWTQDKYYDSLWMYLEPSVLYTSTTITTHLNKLTAASNTEILSLTAATAYPLRPMIDRYSRSSDRFRYINWKVKDFDKFYGLLFRYGIHNEGPK